MSVLEKDSENRNSRYFIGIFSEREGYEDAVKMAQELIDEGESVVSTAIGYFCNDPQRHIDLYDNTFFNKEIAAIKTLIKKAWQTDEEYLAGVKANPISLKVKIAELRHSVLNCASKEFIDYYAKALDFLLEARTPKEITIFNAANKMRAVLQQIWDDEGMGWLEPDSSKFTSEINPEIDNANYNYTECGYCFNVVDSVGTHKDIQHQEYCTQGKIFAAMSEWDELVGK